MAPTLQELCDSIGTGTHVAMLFAAKPRWLSSGHQAGEWQRTSSSASLLIRFRYF
ncbi:hypothetical protein O9992_11165 [Vibrio lentus]|nr:hypothetical protein [Vibrio lentus]